MASCMQHLYMMPQARTSILRAKCDNNSKHAHTLRELQRMFAYLLVSKPCGKVSTKVRMTQNKGKESENSYQKLKRSRWTGTQNIP